MTDDKDPTAHALRLVREEWTKPYREALLELHSAGLAMVTHLPPIQARAAIRWDDAMEAADALLGQDPSSSGVSDSTNGNVAEND